MSSVLRWGGAPCHCHALFPVRFRLLHGSGAAVVSPAKMPFSLRRAFVLQRRAALRLCQYPVPHDKLFVTDFSIRWCFSAEFLLCRP